MLAAGKFSADSLFPRNSHEALHVRVVLNIVIRPKFPVLLMCAVLLPPVPSVPVSGVQGPRRAAV